MENEDNNNYDDEKLFFVILQKDNTSIFEDPLVDDYWLFWEDIMDGYDLYYVVMNELDAETRKLIMKWRGLSFVYSVERNTSEPLTVSQASNSFSERLEIPKANYFGISTNGDLPTALVEAIQNAEKNLETDNIIWQLLDISEEVIGNSQKKKITVSIFAKRHQTDFAA